MAKAPKKTAPLPPVEAEETPSKPGTSERARLLAMGQKKD